MNNFEKIQNMSIEEMADFFKKIANACVGIGECKNCPLRGARVGEDWEHKDCTHVNLVTWLESKVSKNEH